MNLNDLKEKALPFLAKWWFSIVLLFCSWFIIKQFWWALRFNIFFAVNYDHVWGFGLFYFLLDNLNLIMHEAGHSILGIFGWRFLTVLGGTLLQVLIPFLVFVFAWRNRQQFLAQFSLYWLGFSWLETAAYCGDAYLRQMPLIGGLPKSAHDFFNLMNMLNLMDHHKTIAWIMYAIGVSILVLGIFWPLFERKKQERVTLNLEL